MVRNDAPTVGYDSLKARSVDVDPGPCPVHLLSRPNPSRVGRRDNRRVARVVVELVPGRAMVRLPLRTPLYRPATSAGHLREIIGRRGSVDPLVEEGLAVEVGLAGRVRRRGVFHGRARTSSRLQARLSPSRGSCQVRAVRPVTSGPMAHVDAAIGGRDPVERKIARVRMATMCLAEDLRHG